MYQKKQFEPTTSHYKILQTIKLLNDKHLYPLPEGVGKILRGEEDDEAILYKDFPTYKTLISYPSKKICRYILMLLRYEYLTKIFDRKSNELYLRITEFGKIELEKYLKKYKPKFKKKVVASKPTIVKID